MSDAYGILVLPGSVAGKGHCHVLKAVEVSRIRSVCLGVCEVLWQIQPGHLAEALGNQSVIENAALRMLILQVTKEGGYSSRRGAALNA